MREAVASTMATRRRRESMRTPCGCGTMAGEAVEKYAGKGAADEPLCAIRAVAHGSASATFAMGHILLRQWTGSSENGRGLRLLVGGGTGVLEHIGPRRQRRRALLKGEMMRFDGKKVVVTGGAGSLGAAVVAMIQKEG